MKKTLLLTALVVCTGLHVFAQGTRTVKGRVLDEKGEPVIGATVKGANISTQTDADGNYEINVAEGENNVTISYMGAEKKVQVGDGSSQTVTTLEEQAIQVGNVEIYGQKVDRKSFTGAVNTIGANEIARRPITDVTKALEGAAPGVAITSGGGQPGNSPDIQVRGQNTLSASGAPLIVLDGAPYAGTLVSINPNDVETMTILKDASATSIYGARGSNGVIMIVTKRGAKTGKARISVDGSVGVLNRFMPLYETMASKEYIETAYTAWHRAYGGNTPDADKSAEFWKYVGNYNPYNIPTNEVLQISTADKNLATVNPNGSLVYNDSWFDELNRTGLRQNYNVAVSNGDGKSDYYFSVGYVNEKGIIKNSSYDRISSRLTVNSTIASWLKAGMSLSGALDNKRFFLSDDQQAYSNPFMSAQVMGPIYPVYRYDSTGNRMTDVNGDPLYDFGSNDSNNPAKLEQSRPFATNLNPIAALFQDDRSTRALNGFGNTYLEAKFLKDFTLRTNFVVNYLQSVTNSFQNMLYGDARNIGGRMDRTNSNRFNYTFNQLLTWKPSFGMFAHERPSEGHNLDIVLGHENYYVRDEVSNIERSGFTNPVFQEGAAGALGTGSSSALNEHAIESYFSLLNYNFKEKYYLTGSLRTDGSSRFSPESRWGTFWSVGAGWMMSEEGFLEGTKPWLDMLKLRGSYGVAGNENLTGAGYYAWMPRYNFLPNNSNPGLLFSTWGNPQLRWEGSYKFNIGFDFGLWNNRLWGTVDYFNSGANDLLFVQPFAPSVGSSGIYSNVGNMQNSGVELQVNADIVRPTKADGFHWNVRLNLTHLKNKITETQEKDSIIGGGTILAKGFPVNSFFLPRYAGVNSETGSAQYYKRDGSITPNYGDLTTEDYNILGSSFRDLEGSFTSTFAYKNFDLSFLLSFGIGGKFYDGTYARLMSSGRGEAYHVDVANAWKQPGDVTDVPRVQYDQDFDNPLSDRFLVSNSFLNIKNVNLGYRIPDRIMKRMGLTSLRIYVAADNIYYKSARTGLDVQQAFFGSSSFNYFPYRTVMVGINLGL